jgi:hypothetical protein
LFWLSKARPPAVRRRGKLGGGGKFERRKVEEVTILLEWIDDEDGDGTQEGESGLGTVVQTQKPSIYVFVISRRKGGSRGGSHDGRKDKIIV